MLRKVLPLTLACCLNSFADIQNVQLLADNVSQEAGVITAEKNVVVYSQTYLVTADRAIYDQNNSIIELFGNVNMMKGVGEISRSSYAKINLKNNESSFEALFMMDKEMEVWMKSDESSSDDEYYRTKRALVSSCNVQDPDWSISSSSAMLNKESKFLHMFNPVFTVDLPFVGDTPVFYLPYFGFPTDTTRRTGLLPPDMGYSAGEGVYFKQPVYFAPYNEWDLQLDPQIRTKRGAGLYGSFRFVDSPDSRGEFSFGAFRDRESYREREANKNTKELSLKNKTHKGISFEYERDKLVKYLTDAPLQEGLWINATDLNDIDYLNLKGREDDFDSLVTSKFNYFIANEKHFLGAYAKYYIDTEKVGSRYENKTTLQELPSLQYHKFTDTLVLPNLLYSVDVQSHRYDRHIGVTATQYELNVPVSFHLPVFDEAATFSFYENFYASRIDYNRKAISAIDLSEDKSDIYVNNYHRLALHTDLAKPYDDFFHAINFGVEYIKKGYNRGDLSDEYIYSDTVYVGLKNQYENFLAQEKTKDEFLAYATQYFYNSEGRKIIRHTISQGYYTGEDEYGNLKNTIALYPTKNLSFYNKLEYSHVDNEFKKLQSGARYSNDRFGASIMHTMLKKGNSDKDSYLTSYTSINLPRQYKLTGAWQYNLERDYTKTWSVGVLHHRKCWNYGLIYKKDIEPVTTTDGSATRKVNGFLFTVNFYPMGGINYDFSVESDPSTGSS